MAATGGLVELCPLSEEYLSTLSEDRKRRHGLAAITDLFALCGGAATPRDAPRLAIRNLQTMRDDALASQMSDPFFEQEVTGLARQACEYDQLRVMIAPECHLLADIARRQRQLRPASRGSSRGSHPFSDSGHDDWLAEIEGLPHRAYRTSATVPESAVLVEPISLTPSDDRPTGPRSLQSSRSGRPREMVGWWPLTSDRPVGCQRRPSRATSRSLDRSPALPLWGARSPSRECH